MSRPRLAVLVSGGGSNLQSIIDHHAAIGDRRASDLVLVASNREEAGALQRARAAGITAATVASRSAPLSPPLDILLRQHDIELVALAGYVNLVPAEVVRRFHRRILNIHPGPLPAFGGHGMYGSRVHAAVLGAGATHSGPTIHFVDEEYDRGPVIAHWPVAVLPGDTADDLAARVLRAEHRLYPRVIDAVAGGVIGASPIVLPVFDPSRNDLQLEDLVGRALADASARMLS